MYYVPIWFQFQPEIIESWKMIFSRRWLGKSNQISLHNMCTEYKVYESKPYIFFSL